MQITRIEISGEPMKYNLRVFNGNFIVINSIDSSFQEKIGYLIHTPIWPSHVVC